jgi:hypothetical protein
MEKYNHYNHIDNDYIRYNFTIDNQVENTLSVYKEFFTQGDLDRLSLKVNEVITVYNSLHFSKFDISGLSLPL